MTADINAIMVGYEGMRDMLTSIYGRPEQQQVGEALPSPAPEPVPPPVFISTAPMVKVVNQSADNLPKLTPEAFDRMFSGLIGKPN